MGLEKTVEILSQSDDEVVVKVFVDRKLNWKQIYDDSCLDPDESKIEAGIGETMPILPGTGIEEVILVFFRVGRNLLDEEVEQERQKRGLVQDFAAQLTVNAVDRAFAGCYFNGDSWKLPNGKFAFALFDDWSGLDRIQAGVSEGDWDANVFICGRQDSPTS